MSAMMGQFPCVREKRVEFGCSAAVTGQRWTTNWENSTVAQKTSLGLEEVWTQLVSVMTCATCQLHTKLWSSAVVHQLALIGWKPYPVILGSSCGPKIRVAWLCTLTTNCYWWLILTMRFFLWTHPQGPPFRPSPGLVHALHVFTGAEVGCCCWQVNPHGVTSLLLSWLTQRKVGQSTFSFVIFFWKLSVTIGEHTTLLPHNI